MSIIEMMATYASATGLPPTGPHRKLADHLISRFSTPCQSCTGIGLQVVDGATRICADCGGFRRVLSPSAIRRLHQIVGAHHPAVRKQDRRENAALWWAARKSVIPDGPIHLGLETVPAPVPRAPNDAARTVASITWRRGLHSEFLWSSSDTGHCVLWEQLPMLAYDNGTPWVELFAWAAGGADNPERSAQRLLHRGWSETNPAYGWLATIKPSSSSSPTRAFTLDLDGTLSERQIDWLFRAAVHTRRCSPQHFSASARTAALAADKPRNIGPYSFGQRPTVSPKNLEPRDIAEAFSVDARPKNNVIDAQVLALRRSEKASRKDHT